MLVLAETNYGQSNRNVDLRLRSTAILQCLSDLQGKELQVVGAGVETHCDLENAPARMQGGRMDSEVAWQYLAEL